MFRTGLFHQLWTLLCQFPINILCILSEHILCAWISFLTPRSWVMELSCSWEFSFRLNFQPVPLVLLVLFLILPHVSGGMKEAVFPSGGHLDLQLRSLLIRTEVELISHCPLHLIQLNAQVVWSRQRHSLTS